MTAPVWTYWQGPRSTVVDLCLESIQRYHPDVTIVDDAWVVDNGGEDLLALTSGLGRDGHDCLAYRADLIRLWLQYKFGGGTWIDADTVLLYPLDLEQRAEGADLVGVWNTQQRKGFGINGILATPYYIRPGSPVAKHLFQRCRGLLKRMRSHGDVQYGATSVGILSELWQKHRNRFNIRRFQHWFYNRIAWHDCGPLLGARRHPHRHFRHSGFHPACRGYHITGGVAREFSHLTREQLLGDTHHNGDKITLLQYLLQRSLGRSPGTPKRAQDIIHRLPTHEPVTVVEVGVFGAETTTAILQHLPLATVIAVDPYESKNHTGAHEPWLNQNQMDAVCHAAKRALHPFGDRVQWLRLPSTEAADRIPDRSVDAVFIDAVHTEGAVQQDIDAWLPKRRTPSSLFGGHDYNDLRFPGVVRGVQRKATEHGFSIETGRGHTWFFRTQ